MGDSSPRTGPCPPEIKKTGPPSDAAPGRRTLRDRRARSPSVSRDSATVAEKVCSRTISEKCLKAACSVTIIRRPLRCVRPSTTRFLDS